MTKEVKIYTLSQASQWNDLLAELPIDQQDIYYSPEYYKLYEDYGDGKAICFAFRLGSEKAIYPFFINKINKLGYELDKEYYDIQGVYGYNGLLSSSYSESFKNSFFNAFDEYCSENNIIAEFSRLNPYIKNQEFVHHKTQLLLNRRTVVLDLKKSIDQIWTEDISSKNRNMIRKAEKSGLDFSVNNDNYKTFISFYQDTMRLIGADAYYFFDDKYFDSIKENPNAKFCFVFDGDKPVAGLILLLYKNYAHYHLSARNTAYKSNYASNFLLFNAIKYAKKSGAELFHFGGGNSMDLNDSLYRFKTSFSKHHLNFHIGKRIINQDVYSQVIQQWQSKYRKDNSFDNILLRYHKI